MQRANRMQRELVLEQTKRLEFFQRLLERMLREIIMDEGSIRKTLLLASLLRIRQAARAVRVLVDQGCVEEILAIARTLVEITVNAAYLQYASQRELERFLEFHPEAIYQQRNQLQRGGGGVTAGINLVQRLSALVLRQTPLSVGEDAVPAWSQRTLYERAQLADAAGDMPIMRPLVERCYAVTHAAAHGTIGALGSFIDAVQERENPEQTERHAALTEALFAVNLSLLTTSFYLNGAFDLGMDEAIDEAATANHMSRPSLQG